MIRLSPSTLNLFLECPKCFWLAQVKEVHRPKGPFPSLPGGMDLLIKKYFDKYRERGELPPELRGKVDFELFPDIEVLKKWRFWRTCLNYTDEETGATLAGMLDDCGVKNGKYVVIDYKTRGYDVKEGGEAFYQNQMNCYTLLFQKNNLPCVNEAWLIYWIPKDIKEDVSSKKVSKKKGEKLSLFDSPEQDTGRENNFASVKFIIDPHKVETSPETALKVFREAANLIKGPMPQSHSGCTFCSWGNDFLDD